MRNLILDGDGKLWLIDWANAGFYPPYFDVAVIMHFGLQHAFQGFLEKMLMENWKESITRLFAIGFALTTGAFCKPRNQSNHQPSEQLQLSPAQEIDEIENENTTLHARVFLQGRVENVSPSKATVSKAAAAHPNVM